MKRPIGATHYSTDELGDIEYYKPSKANNAWYKWIDGEWIAVLTSKKLHPTY